MRGLTSANNYDRIWSGYENISFHHNLFVYKTHRLPNTAGNGGYFRIINNYAYGIRSSRLSRHQGGNAFLDYENNFYEQMFANSGSLDDYGFYKWDTNPYVRKI